ncbi:MAG: virulence factor, partial [Bacteroidetes bacterium]
MVGNVEIYQGPEGLQVEVKFEKETVWLNRQQLALLFGRDIKTIGKHINNVFKEGELDKDATVAKFATVQIEGGREVTREIEHYNLDVIISVGYRVKSKQGTQFRIWATQRLKDYLVQGYAINEKRLAQKEM